MIKIELDNINGKIIGLNENLSGKLWRELSYLPDNAFFLQKKNKKLMGKDMRKRLFQRKRGYFPVGLLENVKSFLDDNGEEYKIIDNRKGADQYNFYRIRTPFYQLHPHQHKALEEVKKRLVNAFSIATGGGKSLIAMKAIQHWGVNTLIVVPGLNLLEQFRENLELHFGKDMVGTHLDKKLKPIVVANIQGIQKLKEDFFNHFDALITDEAHHDSSDSYYDLNKKYWKYIGYRLFLSATMFRNDGSGLRLKGIVGETTYSFTAREAINAGIILRPKFFIYKVKHYFGYKKGWHQDYDSRIASNKHRDKKLIRVAEKILTSSKKTILILCNRVEHCKSLIEELEKVTNEKIALVTGETKNNGKTFNDFKLGKIRGMVATSQVVGEGIDIPNIDTLFIAGGYTSPILMLQSVGRVIRTDEEKGKKFGIVIDFYDEDDDTMERHSNERLKTYKKYFFKEDIQIFK